jgi:hypothetical protein
VSGCRRQADVPHGGNAKTSLLPTHRGTAALAGGAASLLAGFDGLIWRSRQFNDSFALMLWGDRVARFTDLARRRSPSAVAVASRAG